MTIMKNHVINKPEPQRERGSSSRFFLGSTHETEYVSILNIAERTILQTYCGLQFGHPISFAAVEFGL